MKTLSKRTKTLAAIGGVVVVVAAALVLWAQVNGQDLFGTASAVPLSPYESTIQVGYSVTLKMPNGTNCAWANPDKTVRFKNDDKTGNPMTMSGNFPGKAQVIAKCRQGTGVGYVTVFAPTPIPTKPPLSIDPLNPRVHPSSATEDKVFFKAVNASGGCTWSVDSTDVGWALINGGYELLINSNTIGVFTVTAHCGNETATSVLTFTTMMP